MDKGSSPEHELHEVENAQDPFILSEDPDSVIGAFLKPLQALTGSEYGFIDEVFFDLEGRPYLVGRAISDTSWKEDSRKAFAEGVLRQLLTSKKPISTKDISIGGLPLATTFLGLPICSGTGELLGIVGLFSRAGHYTEGKIQLVAPLLKSCAILLRDSRNEAFRQQAQEEENRTLRLESNKLAKSIEAVAAMAEVDLYGRFVRVNVNFAGSLGYTCAEMLGMEWKSIFHFEDIQSVEQAYERMKAEVTPKSE